MHAKKSTITVQFDVEYDSRYVKIGDISNDLRQRLPEVQDESPRSPYRGYRWSTQAVRVFDYATEPIGFEGISTSFDHIGEALDEYDDNKIDLAEFLDRIREQVGEREANR